MAAKLVQGGIAHGAEHICLQIVRMFILLEQTAESIVNGILGAVWRARNHQRHR